MTIEVRFELRDKVFFMHDNKVKDDHIYSVDIVAIDQKEFLVTYTLRHSNLKCQSEVLFLTKSELLKTL